MTPTKNAPKNTGLGKFENDSIVRTAIAVQNAGDGLSESLKTDPVVLHRGDEVFVVLRTKVRHVAFPATDRKHEDDPEVARLHVLRTESATIVDSELVLDAIETQERRNRERQEADKGAQKLDGMDEASLLRKDHEAGKHRRTRKGCPECELEKELEAAGE